MNVKLKNGVEINPNEITDSEWEELLKAREEKSGVWKPKEGEQYYYVESSNGDIYSYTNGNDNVDNSIFSLGGAFPTKEAAQKHLAYLKALQVLRGDTKGYEWKDGDYYAVYMSSDRKHLYYGTYAIIREGIKFANSRDAQESISAHEKEWRIVLGVE